MAGTDYILKPTIYKDIHGMIGFVVKVKAKNRSRDSRVFRIQRNERTERFQGSFNRKWIILGSNVTDSCNGVFPDKLDFRKSFLVQAANLWQPGFGEI